MALTQLIKSAVIVCIMCVSLTVFAQEVKTPAETAKFRTSWLKGNLDLTADQCKQVYPIMLEYVQAEKDASTKSGNADLVKKAAVKRDNDLKKVLTEAQFNKFHRQDVTSGQK